MNPNAKEFVPAHLMKKRQDEAERLTDLNDQLEQVNLNNEPTENGDSQKERPSSAGDTRLTAEQEKADPKSESENTIVKPQTSSSSQEDSCDDPGAYTDGPHDYPDDPALDEAYLLEKGESVCEFNGEKFIIPGDDEYVPPIRAGYDFGNDLDNEDEDVCNAFEKFLEDLPN